MVTDWDMRPIWLQSVIRSPHHNTNIVRMTLRRVEIRVVPDEHWHGHDCAGCVLHRSGKRILVSGVCTGEQFLYLISRLNSKSNAQGSKIIQGGLVEDVVSQCLEKWPIELSEKFGEIDDEVANSCAAVDSCLRLVAPKWNIFEWEVVVLVVLDKTLQSSCVHVILSVVM